MSVAIAGNQFPAPAQKRAVAFIDGQKLFHAIKKCFNYTHPNYHVLKLSKAVCDLQGWELAQTRFYTGIPKPADNFHWNYFWQNKLRSMSRAGVKVFSRALVYRTETIPLPNGRTHSFLYAQEKGVDVRIALDLQRLAYRREFDVAIIFSQDQDLSEAARDVRELAAEQGRWVEVASAFPCSAVGGNRYGIGNTIPIEIRQHVYDLCIDTYDYRPRHGNRPR
ncbi:MAG TPA: NYN domain-containing protein [Tepidisphaeraceae bacterium]|jgi:uncharacterized LabA/DUF88 family protein